MNDLDSYLQKLNESTYDRRDNQKIIEEFDKLVAHLVETQQPDLAKVADIDRQVFLIPKSFTTQEDKSKGTVHGLSWRMAGEQTLEDGKVIPVYFPDVTALTKENFEHFEKRYAYFSNPYIKTEFGLMVYFGRKTPFSKHTNFKKQLTTELFSLAKEYLARGKSGGKEKFYISDFHHTVSTALTMAIGSKLVNETAALSAFIFETHHQWEVTKESSLRILLDLSALLLDNYSNLKDQVDFEKLAEKNLLGAKELEKTYIWGALYAVDRNIKIANKTGKQTKALVMYKAQLYEKLAHQAEENHNPAALTFAEQALRIFLSLKSSDDIKRLEARYADLRGTHVLSEIRQAFPPEYVEAQNVKIKQAVEESDEANIIDYFIQSPWYPKITEIEEQGKLLSEQSVLMAIIPASIVDKYGNTIETFNSPDEKVKYSFWEAYSLAYQTGTYGMMDFFIEAYMCGKLSYKSVMDWLETTWFNEPIARMYHGQPVTVIPLDTVKPGLKGMFDELDAGKGVAGYSYDFVTVIDSMALKVESLLRFLCERLGIATFKPRMKGAEKLIMEKLIDDLLADLAHMPEGKPEQVTSFDEEDRIYIKYVMTEKVGMNLRNEVAHGLLDIDEYTFEYALAAFCIILRLSKYKLTEKDEQS